MSIVQKCLHGDIQGKVVEPFLPFQVSRAALFYDLSARETCPLHCSPRLRSGPGLPPQISREKRAPSRQSLQKRPQALPSMGAFGLTVLSRAHADTFERCQKILDNNVKWDNLNCHARRCAESRRTGMTRASSSSARKTSFFLVCSRAVTQEYLFRRAFSMTHQHLSKDKDRAQ